MKLAALLMALAVSPCSAESPFARAARVTVSGQELVVGASDEAAASLLDCAAPAAQHTVLRCRLGAPAAASAVSLGRRVENAVLTLHFQGRIVNMSVEFAPDNDADDVLSQLKAALGREPKIQYWADDAHLFASYIWVDQETEIEVTKTVKGGTDGRVGMHVSSLLGGLPLSPDDAP